MISVFGQHFCKTQSCKTFTGKTLALGRAACARTTFKTKTTKT